MANISTSFILGKHTQDFYDDYRSDKLFTLPFSEHDVLSLQEKFIALGVHIIKTKNVVDGRAIIQTILNSLNYYHNISCVTQSNYKNHSKITYFLTLKISLRSMHVLILFGSN